MLVAAPDTLQRAIKHLKQDDALRQVIDAYGTPTLSPHTNYYQELVESIISQQLSVKAAAAIVKRFLILFSSQSFPTPDEILSIDIETYRTAGLSRQKATYIRDLATKVLDGTIQFKDIDTRSNDEIITELTKIKGVGVWTAHMFLMFCMGRLDVLPVGDLGIKNGIQKLYNLSESPTPEQMELIAIKNNWHPYESVASWYIWRSLDNMPAVEAVN
jgi:DNA-3-methyladenine glycosylase II